MREKGMGCCGLNHKREKKGEICREGDEIEIQARVQGDKLIKHKTCTR